MSFSKNTTTTLVSVLVLMIFSFLNPLLANTNYQSKLVLSKNTSIDQIRFFRDSYIYSNYGQLYFKDSAIKLLNSNEQGIVINDIFIDNNDFYLATDMGIFHNYRRIFSKEPCQQIIKTPSQIFIACQQGIYNAKIEKKTLQTHFDWQLDELSPQNPNFISLNKSKTKVKYASATNGFFYHERSTSSVSKEEIDLRKKSNQWINRSYGLKRDFQDSFGFGRFLEHEAKLYLATSSGIFTSANQGESWVKHNTGLKANADGFFSIRQINLYNGQLLALTSQGLYQSLIQEELDWHQITIANTKKSSNYQSDFLSLDILDSTIILSNSQGQVFNLSPDTSYTASIHKEENLQQNTIEAIIKAEPKIQDLHNIALEFAGIPTGKNFRTYKRQARLRNLVPDFEAFAEHDSQDILSIETDAGDSFTSNTSSINTDFGKTNLDRDDDKINTGIKFKWNLSNLIYDPEINDINTSARITANIRENILTELTQIYYNRKELIYRLLKQSLNETTDGNYKDKLRLEEYTAQLDARTGAWFSQELEKTIQSIVENLDPENRARILALYT
ncbi:MAG: hypothetical protein O2962_03140 [Cyanobacteria bacterium]|nr:hypothetical protein [Cyanobacteriota bacterium]